MQTRTHLSHPLTSDPLGEEYKNTLSVLISTPEHSPWSRSFGWEGMVLACIERKLIYRFLLTLHFWLLSSDGYSRGASD